MDVGFLVRQFGGDTCLIFPILFVKGRPVVKMPPTEVAINPISANDIEEGVRDAVNFPTLRAAGYQANAL
jgi:hypothetical protein